MPRKLPWMKWDVAAWLSDEKLRACSVGARGLWADMLSLMFKCDRRGYLQVGGKPATPEQLARMTGCSVDEVSRLLAELLHADVASRLEDGTLYSRRMVRETQLSHTRAEAGRLGGRRTLGLLKQTPKQTPRQSVQQSPKQTSYILSSPLEDKERSQNPPKDTPGIGGVGGRDLLEQHPKHRPKGHAVDALDPDFDRFWNVYPRHVAKMDARIAWDKLAPDRELVERILAAVAQQKESPQWKKGILPNAAAWLTGCRWEDELLPTGKAGADESVEERIARARREQCNGPGTNG